MLLLHLLEPMKIVSSYILSDPGDEQEFIYSKVFLDPKEIELINDFCDERVNRYEDILERNTLPKVEENTWNEKINNIKHLKEKINLGRI